MGKATLFCTFVLLIWQGRAREGHKTLILCFLLGRLRQDEKQMAENEDEAIYCQSSFQIQDSPFAPFLPFLVFLGAVPPATEAPAPQIPI